MTDVPLLQRWFNDPQTRAHLERYKPISEITERKFIEKAADPAHGVTLGIVLKRGGRLIGACGLRNVRWKDRTAEFGITIGEPSLRGRGLGTEATRLIVQFAFETLNLHRVQLGVLAHNAAGIRAYEKAGFVREGVQREHCFVGGRYVDHVVYGILARDYFRDSRARPSRRAVRGTPARARRQGSRRGQPQPGRRPNR